MIVTHLLIFGDVQGIGYRSFVKSNARKLGLVGWVRNLPEGTVEAEVAGLQEAIDHLVRLCKKGPFMAEVKAVDVQVSEKDFPYAEFVVRHDTD